MRGNGRDILVPLPSGVRREVHEIGVVAIICRSIFDPIASIIAYSRSSEANWAWIDPAQRRIHIQFSSGRVYVVPER